MRVNRVWRWGVAAAIAAGVVGAVGTPEAAEAAAGAQATYASMVQKVKQGDTGVDFTALRMAYDAQSTSSGADSKLRATMFAALHRDDWPAVITSAGAVLENDYLDIDAHMFAGLAYEKTNQPEKAAFHRAVGNGLLRSILASGDGRTPATAFVVISVDEEYSVLRHYGLHSDEQSLVESGGHSYDVLTADDGKTAEKATVVFLVDRPMAKIDARLKEH
jgi:hypothetical protein